MNGKGDKRRPELIKGAFRKNYEKAIEKLQKSDIIQLFKRVFYLPFGHTSWNGVKETMLQGVIWQNIIHKNWLERRKNKIKFDFTEYISFSVKGMTIAISFLLYACKIRIFDINIEKT